MGRIEVDGAGPADDEQGTGEPLVLVHGTGRVVGPVGWRPGGRRVPGASGLRDGSNGFDRLSAAAQGTRRAGPVPAGA